MRVGEGRANLLHDVQFCAQVKRLAVADDLVERLPVQEFHHDVGQAVLVAEVVNRNNVRMAEIARVARFLVEALEHVRFAGESLGERLDGHIAADARIAGAIDNAHAPLSEDANNVVLADPFWRRFFQSSVLSISGSCAGDRYRYSEGACLPRFAKLN